MTAHSMNITAQGIITALSPLPAPRRRTVDELHILRDLPKNRDNVQLHVVLKLKKARGDTDCDTFKNVALIEFGTLSATSYGAHKALAANRNGSIAHEAFVADLAAVLDGRA